MKKFFKQLLITLSMVVSISASADSFSLKNTKTSLVYGPFENERGTRFKINNTSFCILSTKSSQILFADYPPNTYYGPYDFKNGHIIKLGKDVYEIINITASITKDPIAQEIINEANSISSAATSTNNHSRINIATPKTTTKETVSITDTPKLEKRELAPIPSTNPAAYKEPELFEFKMEQNILPRSGRVWIEPVNTSKYNWKIGNFNGEKNSEIERKRIGVFATYNGWFAEAAYSLSGKSSGTLVPDGSTLSDLKIDGGKGYMLRGGYNYRFTIDGNWNGSFKAMFEYAKEDYDLTATTFQEVHNTYIDMYDERGNIITTPEADNPLASYGYVDTSSSISITEKTLSFGFGIDRTEDIWSVGVELGFVAYSDLSSSGSVTVGQSNYKLEAERSHPIICKFNGWYKPVDYMHIYGEIYLGSDTGLRLGVGKEF